MNIRMFGTPFLLIMLLFCSQIVLPPSPVFAVHLPWCGCGNCWMAKYGGCTCGYPYYYCSDDAYPSQDYGLIEDHLTDISSIFTGSTYTVWKVDGTNSAIGLMRGQKCLNGRVTLTMLRNAKNDQRFASVRLHERDLLALQLETDSKR